MASPRFTGSESKLTKAVRQLVDTLMREFKQLSSIFRKFDRRNKGRVSYSDFAFAIEDLRLNFDRELIVQIFNYLDRDNDSALIHADFVALC